MTLSSENKSRTAPLKVLVVWEDSDHVQVRVLTIQIKGCILATDRCIYKSRPSLKDKYCRQNTRIPASCIVYRQTKHLLASDIRLEVQCQGYCSQRSQTAKRMQHSQVTGQLGSPKMIPLHFKFSFYTNTLSRLVLVANDFANDIPFIFTLIAVCSQFHIFRIKQSL